MKANHSSCGCQFADRPVVTSRQPRRGFTLIELLTVLAIIGILTVILVPVIRGALIRASEFAVITEMNHLGGAIEKYKAKTFAYPVDFVHPKTIGPHVVKLSGRAQNTNKIINLNNLSDGSTWYASTLVNPHAGPNGLYEAVTGNPSPGPRKPSTIDPAEALVFWLFETTNNPQYPLGAVYNGSTWVLDPAWSNVWEGNHYFEFNAKQFSDLDGDGWFEYRDPDEASELPFVYFDSRSYNDPFIQESPALLERLAYPPGPAGNFTAPPYQAVPYYQAEIDVDNDGDDDLVGWEPQKYQIHHSGVDEDFGEIVDTSHPHKLINGDVRENITIADRDNITSVNDARFDKEFED